MIEFHLDTRVGRRRPTCRSSSRCARPCASACSTRATSCRPSRRWSAQLAINPNTVLKAYRELEHEGLVGARPGVGTFVTALAARTSPLAAHGPLRVDLQRWLAKARRAGLDDESIEALFRDSFRSDARART